MTPHQFPSGTLYASPFEEVLTTLQPASLHGVVTDPPYLMGMMGRDWDSADNPVQQYRDWFSLLLDYLRPGAFLLSCTSARTYHWQAAAAEVSGYWIHPALLWIRTDTMPKAHDLQKQWHRQLVKEWLSGIPDLSTKDARNALSAAVSPEYADKVGDNLPDRKAGLRILSRLRGQHGEPPALPAEAERWEGVKYGGQVLKPAVEPILMAQKPYSGKPLDSVRQFGCGAINVLGTTAADGSYPANCLVTGLDRQDAIRELGDWADSYYIGDNDLDFLRFQVMPTVRTAERDAGLSKLPKRPTGGMKGREDGSLDGHIPMRRNTGIAVKPISLMAWLIRLVIPPNGLVLDPFAGSGTTGIAAHRENRNWICAEENEEAATIAKHRLQYWTTFLPDMV